MNSRELITKFLGFVGKKGVKLSYDDVIYVNHGGGYISESTDMDLIYDFVESIEPKPDFYDEIVSNWYGKGVTS